MPSTSKPISTKRMSHHAPTEIHSTQDGEWQIIPNEESNSKDDKTQGYSDNNEHNHVLSSQNHSPSNRNNVNDAEAVASPPAAATIPQAQAESQTCLALIRSPVGSPGTLNQGVAGLSNAEFCPFMQLGIDKRGPVEFDDAIGYIKNIKLNL